MKFRIGFAAAASLGVALPALGHGDSMEDIIDARQGYFSFIGHNAGALFAMAKGEKDYDADQAATFAANLKALAAMDTGSLWPEGSDKEHNPGKTRALKIAWDTFPAILEKNDAFKKATADLAEAAGGGIDALRGKIGALGDACKGCHDTYRAKDF